MLASSANICRTHTRTKIHRRNGKRLRRSRFVLLTGIFLVAVAAAAGCTKDTVLVGLPESTDIPQSASQPTSQSAADGHSAPTGEAEGTVTQIPTADPAQVAASFEGATSTEWGLNVTGVTTSLPGPGIALTLDACGGPGGDGYDQELIDGLIARQVPATLFLNGRWIRNNPELAEQLAANPLFELANHGTSHLPLSVAGQSAYGISGTGSVIEVVNEVWDNHLVLTELTGKGPQYFRSGTAHYDEVAVSITKALGEQVIGFNVNADAGATFPAETVEEVVSVASPGSIIIAHMNQPDGDTASGLLAGVDSLLAQGQVFVFIDGKGYTG